jgi:hypothetical protein
LDKAWIHYGLSLSINLLKYTPPNPDRLVKKFWVDNYYDASTKKWRTDPGASEFEKPSKRAYVLFIIVPICKLCKVCIDDKTEVLNKITTALGITVDLSENQIKQTVLIMGSSIESMQEVP